jgi:hypothetical protein
MSQRRNSGSPLAISLLLLTFAGGCARQPPGQNSLSGKRLIVTLRFRSPVNPNNHYFFLINNAGDQNAPGPIPVLNPPYGNGFATGAGGTNGFTDFVRFDNLQPQGYGVYHAIGDPNLSNFIYEGRPITTVPPDPNDPRTASVLQFEIDLSQLIVQPNGAPLADQNQAVTQAKAIRFLQVNIVATNVIPRDVVTPVLKQVDSLGDTRTLSGASSFLILDVSQNRVYRNQDFVGQLVYEPTDIDVFGSDTPDPTLDLIDWTIEIRQQ